MAVDGVRFDRKIWQTLSSIKTGVILLITVVVLSAAGTIVLQRPATEADEMQRAYSPHVLRILDAVGLTDVFHAWWFVTLMLLVSASIIAASIASHRSLSVADFAIVTRARRTPYSSRSVGSSETLL